MAVYTVLFTPSNRSQPAKRRQALLESNLPRNSRLELIEADERVLIPLQKAGKVAVIPPKANRKIQREYDKDLYKARHLIENFFAKLKLYRAIATRYDKTALNFLAAIHLAATVICLI
jgi:uncharacterized protein YuzE